MTQPATNSIARTEQENNFITKFTVTFALPHFTTMCVGHVLKLARDTEKGGKKSKMPNL